MAPVREDLGDERRRRCQNDGATQPFRQASSRSRATAPGGGHRCTWQDAVTCVGEIDPRT